MTTIGRVIYEADIDGRKLPVAARKIGREAGADMGKEMGKALDSDFDRALTGYARKWAGRMRSQGDITGRNFTTAMNGVIRSQLEGLVDDLANIFGKVGGIEEFAQGFDNAGDAVGRLRSNVERLNSQNLLTEAQYKTLNTQIDKYEGGVTKLREAEADAGLERSRQILMNADLERSLDTLAVKHDLYRTSLLNNNDAMMAQTDLLRDSQVEMDKTDRSSRKLVGGLGSQTSAWKSLSANTRQWILIIGAISAAGTEIGTLGAAAGAGLTILGGALGSTIVGVGTAIAAFQDLGNEISELPAEVQPAAVAFQALGDMFGVLQDRIQAAAVPGLVAGFDSLRATVEALIPSFELVGTAVGEIFARFAASIGPGTKGFENLNTLIAGAVPVLQSLADAAIIFGEAFGNIFVISMPFVEEFAGWLATIADEFRAWTETEAGRQAITEWLDAGTVVLAAFGDLLGTVGEMFADLVTPETVEQTVTFLETIGEFIPIFGEILAVLGDLNIFGLLAELLLSIGQIIEPILPQLSEMATILSEGLMTAFAALVPPLQELFIALGPILPLLAQLAVDVVIALIPAIVALTPLFQPLADAFIGVLNVIIPLLPTLTDLIVIIISGLVPVLVPLIEQVATVIETFAPFMPLIVNLISAALVPLTIAFTVILPIIGSLIDLFSRFWAPINALLQPLGELIGGWDALDASMGDFAGAVGGWADGIIGAIEGVIGWIDDAIAAFANLFGASASAPTPPSGGPRTARGGTFGPMASGGMANFQQVRTIGEAGREAVVPLQRPLSQVDPSVRMLAAFAQGKLGSMGGGSGKTVNFMPGSIVVNTVSPDGRLVAESVVDQVVANAEI